MFSSLKEARAYFRTHYLPDGSLSHALQVYLNLLKSAHQPVGAREIQLFAKNVVEQVQADYVPAAHWPTIVRHTGNTRVIEEGVHVVRETTIFYHFSYN